MRTKKFSGDLELAKSKQRILWVSSCLRGINKMITKLNRYVLDVSSSITNLTVQNNFGDPGI